MNIRNKISSVFSLVVILLAIAGIFVYNGTAKVKKNLNYINDKYEEMVNVEEQIVKHYKWLGELESAIKLQIEFTGESDYRKCGLGQWIKHIDFENIKGDEFTIILSNIREDHIILHRKSDEIIKLLKEEKYDEGKNIYFHEILPIINDIDVNVDALYDYYQKQIEDTNFKIIKYLQTMKIYTVITPILVIIFTILSGMILKNQIVKPMNYIIEKITLISNGNLAISINPKYLRKSDEIGKLSRAFSEMSEKLIKYIGEIEDKKEVINFLAYHDSLTKLPNRRKFHEQTIKLLNKSKNGAIFLLDLDNFKNVNDSLGHVFGDEVLKEIARLLLKLEEDEKNLHVSRFGGDEFLLLKEFTTNDENIDLFINRLNDLFNKTTHSNDINELIMYADLALYSIKNSTKNGYAVFSTAMSESFKEKEKIADLLKVAIENDGFKLLYQSQIDVKTGNVCGYEALLRLNNCDVSPNEFIPVAEDNGMIIKIDRIVTEKVVKQLKLWKEEGYSIKKIALNFSVVQLHDSGYIDFLKMLLEKYGISSKYIEIEITESVLIDNKDMLLPVLSELRNMGIRIAVDDFGSGYSSLTYLAFLPVDCIKLDRSLCIEFLSYDNKNTIKSLIELVHSLNLEVLAEGIEIYDQVKVLEECKCDFIQGYYFSKPIEAEAVAEMLNEL